jgi:N-acyl-phosphatidylethanolamine-hydrolysing phospholipase D
MQQPDFRPVKDCMKATWLGHSTVLIQDGHINMLVDPVFGVRASPVSFVGPKRFRRPACDIQELPRIDAVFISHDHYDHFDT